MTAWWFSLLLNQSMQPLRICFNIFNSASQSKIIFGFSLADPLSKVGQGKAEHNFWLGISTTSNQRKLLNFVVGYIISESMVNHFYFNSMPCVNVNKHCVIVWSVIRSLSSQWRKMKKRLTYVRGVPRFYRVFSYFSIFVQFECIFNELISSVQH